MRIGILQTGAAPDQLLGELGDYPDLFVRMLGGHGFTFQTWRVLDGVFPDDVTECEGWLITGSKHGVYEDHAWIPPLEAFIRAAYGAHVPMVGICFGHQIIAQAMGGRVEKYAGGWAVGATEYDFEGRRVVLNAWHQDQVVARPAAATVVGGNDFCANAALLYDDRMFTVQAHPEFRAEFVDGLMRVRGKGVVPDPLLAVAQERLGMPLDESAVAGQIAEFFKRPRVSLERA
ncbi:GMP synthase (glutamine-hydrolysing) [Pseudorhodobacter antarcticus]|uniref:GMP synthase (Glutamine-hydrolysing) n=1 Tax=Pseudorhodobacter antarcticus TaxID=1077947 RepID=A0A1H8I978_9RHOB|nr:type 1 glutamine amidotransferase [Pseudorhodobacter antarcticus]SEN64832.1 GMP synthase (glutamine-hydrolysing) [Pseudorhodobacter antarcticus]